MRRVATRASGGEGVDSLVGNLLDSLGGPALGDLGRLLGIILSGSLLLDRRAEGLGTAVVVAGELRLGAEARGVLSEVVIESSLELDLFQVPVADCASMLADELSLFYLQLS